MLFKNFKIILLLILILANLWFWHNFVIGLLTGLLYLFICGKKTGNWLLPNQERIFKNFFGVFFVLSLISFVGAVVYFFYKLNNLAISLILILIPLALAKLTKRREEKKPKEKTKEKETRHLTLPYLILVLVYLIIILSLFSFVSAQSTTEAIRSPWQLLPAKLFYYYFLATFILLTIIWQDRQRKLTLGLIIFHWLFSSLVAIIVYKLGFGFDSLIHQATEKEILAQGMILPKNLFYLGQYSLVVILAKLFAADFVTLDKLLTPLSFSLFLPPLIYYSLNQALGFEKRISALLAFSFLAWPFASFTFTTPQNLANLYILITIFLGLLYLKNKIKIFPLLILSVTSLAIHPLAGIPTAFLTLLLYLGRYFRDNQNIPQKKKKIILAGALFLLSFSLPILFFLNYLIQGGFAVAFKQLTNASNLASVLGWLRLYFINQYNFLFDLAYFYKINFYFFVFILTMLALYIFKDKLKFLASFLLAFVVTFINFLFLRLFIFFAFVISYEQSDYSQRVLEISFYFLVPILLYFGYLMVKKLENKSFIYKFSFLILLSLFITSSFYLSYPRDDEYQTNPGYSLSASDIKAVHYIDKEAKSPFIVLANQQVSAAAIREFGFKNFYPIKIDEKETYHQFYYPIPTSSPLYTYYLSMVYDNPSPEITTEAMKLVGVKEAYFVINNYWWHFDKIIKEAKKTANTWQSIDNEKIYIFKYTLN
ncbi:MAG: hypothetical protein V1892_01450 [bacterium]